MLTSLLGIEKTNQQMLKSIQQSVVELVKVQKAGEKAEQKRANDTKREAKRQASDKGKKGPGAALKGSKEEQKKEKGFLERLLGGLTGGLTGIMAAPLIIKAGAALIGGGLIAALTNKKVRDALFEAMKWAFDALRKTSGKVANHAWHGFFSGFTGGGMSTEAKQARRAKGDSDDKEERKRLTELITLIDDKEQADRGYFKAASKYEKLKKEGAKAERIEKAKAFMEEQKAKSEAFHERFGAYEDLIQKHGIDMTTSTRMRTVDEIKFGALNFAGFEYDLLKETGRYRKGGPIRVPGRGTGDTVPAILPPGSFVMNRNATGYQMGGIPVMLEPGEDVYAPGQWGAPEVLMNSLMPRFQRGGEVDAKQPKNPDAKAETTGAKISSPDKAVPGGRLSFIGDGSGISGVLNMYDGANNLVASVGAVSGQNRTAGATQEQRRQVSGTMNPIPDGNYPLSGFQMHPGSTQLGDWSAYIGGPGGAIGNRGGMMIHTDLGHNGTAGCIGTETGPGRGTKKDRQFSNMYQKVQPSSVEVALVSRTDGKVSGVQGGDDNSDPGSSSAPVNTGNPLMGLLGNITMESTKAIGLPGLGQYMNVLGEVIAEELGALGGFLFGGGLANNLMNPAKADDTQDKNTPTGTGNAGAGAVSISDPNAKALLNAIADAEGTSKYPNNGYQTQFTGTQFKGNKHPRQIRSGGGYSSDAAGRYQFLSTTWDGLGMDDMSPENQDRGALKLVRGRGVDLSDGLSLSEIYRIGGEWASVEGGPQMKPGGSYGGQAKFSAKEFLKMYENYGGTVQQKQTGGMVNLAGKPAAHMRRFAEAQELMEAIAGAGSQPIIIMNGAGGGGGDEGGGTTVMPIDGGPAPPNLPDGPNVVALLELQNRLALGAAI